MSRDMATTKIAAADLKGLLDAMTPPDRQCSTTEMSPLMAQNLNAAPEEIEDCTEAASSDITNAHVVEAVTARLVLPVPRAPLPDRPSRMSIASAKMEHISSTPPEPLSSSREDLLFVAAVFFASFALGGILMLS
jgi:hypothetical protein